MIDQVGGKGLKEGIEQSFINRISLERFAQEIQKDGQINPCIEIQVLGDLQLSIAGKIIALSKTFTPMQRRFISILAILSNLRFPLTAFLR